MYLGSPFLNRITIFASFQLSRICFGISILSEVISPDSFLMLIDICPFLYLLTRLGPFLASGVSCISSFPFLCALVLRFFFTNLLSSAYSALSFSAFFAFYGNSFPFLSKLSNFCIFSTLLDCGLVCMVFIDSEFCNSESCLCVRVCFVVLFCFVLFCFVLFCCRLVP